MCTQHPDQQTVLILILIYFEWRDTENQQYFYVQHSSINCFVLRFMFEFAEFCNKFLWSSKKIQVN